MTPPDGNVNLTKRQTDVLSLIAEGYSNRAIGERLGISENGVKNHVSRLLDKFDVPTRAALVRAAHPDNGATAAPFTPADVVRLLSDSLAEVLGTSATATLMKRACKRAGIAGWNPQSPPTDTPMQTVSALVAALWPLLIEMTGNVLIARLQARGFASGGDVSPAGIAAWMK